MRTTVDIQDELLRRAKALAAETDRTLGEVVSDALRIMLQRPSSDELPPLPVARSSEVAIGIDLSPRGMRDLLEVEDEEAWRAPA